MIIITKRLTVIKVSSIRFAFLSLLICAASYYILKNTSELSPSVNAVISFILSILTSLVFELSIFRAKLLDNEIIGAIFRQFEDGNEAKLMAFYNSFSSRFSKKYRKLNMAGEVNPIRDLSFLFRVYRTTLKEECKNLDFLSLIDSYNELKSRKTIFNNFGFNFDYLYSTLVINSIYTKHYIKEIKLDKLETEKSLGNKELGLLFEFATKSTNEISDTNLDIFIKNTKQLKELISYVNLPNRGERLLPIIQKYLKLLESIGEEKTYTILKEHIILQLTNCFHFANEYKHCKDETRINLISIIEPYGYTKISDLITFCHNFQFSNELIYFLNSIDSENQDKLLNIIYNKIGLLKKTYSNIINIAILNKLAYSINKNYDFFIRCYEEYNNIFQRDVVSNANYEKSIILYDSFYNLLKKNVSPEIIVDDLVKLEESAKNSAIKMGGGRNALIISLFTGNNDLTDRLFVKYSTDLNYISRAEFDQIISGLNSNKGELTHNIFYTMFWYPVQLILENVFIPYIDRQYFYSFFKSENKIIV